VDGQAVHSGQFVGERTPDGAGDAGDEDSHCQFNPVLC
jgi:hypothetical protein